MLFTLQKINAVNSRVKNAAKCFTSKDTYGLFLRSTATALG